MEITVKSLADPELVTQRLAAGEDGWALIAERPDDVATHDLALAALAAADPAFAEIVDKYLEQRASDSVWDKWPDEYDLEDGLFDRRLSPVIGAAFRAGLTFEADHERAASSLVNALAYLDDDVAMTAFAAAIEACRMDDERLEYVVAALRSSPHPRAQAILARAAWRFFETFEATKAAMAKTAKRGPTLDDLFKTHSHLLPALIWRMRTGDDEAEKLVDRVCSVTSNMAVLGAAYAAAFQQVGDKRLERHRPLVEAYTKMVLALGGELLAEEAKYNVAEAGLALAKLDPDAAGALLRPVLSARPDGSRAMWLDKIGCALAGLGYLAPDDPEVLAWIERICGNRTGAVRVYGALRGIAEGKIVAAKSWLAWHRYHGCSSNHIGERPMIMRAAGAALVALGEPEPPAFDETDEFASARSDADLPRALQEPHQHLTDWVFKRIIEKELRSPEIVRVAGEVLRDSFRFSADDEERVRAEERTQGLACMIFQGAPALDELATLLALPHIAGSDKTIVVTVMSVIADAPSAFARLARATAADVLAAITPSAATYATIDLAAGWGLATLGERAWPAIEAAVRWRFAMVEAGSDHWIEDEPIAGRLARLAAALPQGKALLADLAARENYHAEQVVEIARGGTGTPVGMADADTRTFVQQLKPNGGPTYTCTVAREGAKLVIDYRAEDIHIQGIVNERGYAQHGVIDTSSVDAARELAERVAMTLGVLGFAVVAPPAAKRTKGKKGRGR